MIFFITLIAVLGVYTAKYCQKN